MKISKKHIIIIIALLVGVISITGIILGIRINRECKMEPVKINPDFVYDGDETIIIGSSVEDNVTLACKIIVPNDEIIPGSPIYAVDSLGNVEKIVDFFDGGIGDAVVVNNHLRLIHQRQITNDFSKNNKYIQVWDINLLEPEEYTITQFIQGEIKGFDKSTGDIIYAKDMENYNSNILTIGNYNYIELIGVDEFVYAVCYTFEGGADVKIVNLETDEILDIFSTSQDIVSICEYNKELYIIASENLIRLNEKGEAKVILKGTESNCDLLLKVSVTNNGIRVYGNNGYEEIKDEKVTFYKYSEKIRCMRIL